MPSQDAQASIPSDGVLAQLVEHRTFNPLVIGSNPIHPTIFLPDSRRLPNAGLQPTVRAWTHLFSYEKLALVARAPFLMVVQDC